MTNSTPDDPGANGSIKGVDTGRHGRKSWIAACSAAKFAVSFAASEAFPIVPLAAEAAGMPRSKAMLVLGTQPFVYVICSPLSGCFLDRAKRRPNSTEAAHFKLCVKVLLIGLLATGVGTLFLAMGIHWTSLVNGRVLQGCGGAAAEVAAMVLITAISDEEQLASAEGILETWTGMGYIIGLPLGGLLFGRGMDMLSAFGVGAAVCAIALLMVLSTAAKTCSSVHALADSEEEAPYVLEDGDDKQQRVGGSSLSAPCCLGVIAFVIFAFGVFMGNVYASIAEVDEHRYGFPAGKTAGLLLLIALSYTLTCSKVGEACDGPVTRSWKCMEIGLAVGICAYLALGVGGEAWVQGVGLFILGISEAMILIPAFPVLLDVAGGFEAGAAAGVASAILNTRYYAGECVGPLLSLVSVDKVGFSTTMLLQAAGVGLLALLIVVCSKQRPS
eukprot:TRINITY_DN46540_c0_g1_i1.p1 TRINITY_DN46540_c0_g1~~TRINITY_DN46540_c0_g1_i1.p1  ORF type:complete len:444 (+),score=69.01 TRINITY_DN46540_c0_g1_i1:66-1397(+)